MSSLLFSKTERLDYVVDARVIDDYFINSYKVSSMEDITKSRIITEVMDTSSDSPQRVAYMITDRYSIYIHDYHRSFSKILEELSRSLLYKLL